MQFKVINQGAILGFSDLVDHELYCYPLEETLIEKLR